MQTVHTRPERKSYFCPKCKRMLKVNESKFKMHYEKCGIRTQVSHQKQLPSSNEEATWFKCSICGYTSLHEVALKKHMTTKHVGILPGHKCDECGRIFSSSSGLYKHKSKHHRLMSTSVMPMRAPI